MTTVFTSFPLLLPTPVPLICQSLVLVSSRSIFSFREFITLISIMISVCSPTSSEWGFSFSYIPTSICCWFSWCSLFWPCHDKNLEGLLICISHIAKDIEHFQRYLPPVFIVSFENSVQTHSPFFLIGYCIFLTSLSNMRWLLYVLPFGFSVLFHGLICLCLSQFHAVFITLALW